MGLRLNNVVLCEEDTIKRKFDSTIAGVSSKGIILLRIDIDFNYYSPIHWMLREHKSNKLEENLDIALNPLTGRIKYIKYLLEDVIIRLDESLKFNSVENGFPVFDLTSAEEYDLYLKDTDNEGNIIIYKNKNSLLLLFNNNEIDLCLNMNNDNSLFFNSEKILIGLGFNNLSDVEIQELIKSELLSNAI